MKKFVSFGKIPQFRNTIKAVSMRAQYVGKDENGDVIVNRAAPLPKLIARGTVKLHGTNAAVCLSGDEMWAQSRKNIITPEKDNAGFATFVAGRADVLRGLLETARDTIGDIGKDDIVSIFGEWVGNKICKGTAISTLTRRFLIFAVKVSRHIEDAEDPSTTEGQHYDYKYLRSPDDDIYNVSDFPTYEVEIDFAMPGLAQNEFAKLTQEVEDQCPVAHAFGVDGIGEGIVWTLDYKDVHIRFKTKGAKHSASKVKTVAAIDPEVLRNITEFVEYAATENRFNQAIREVFGDEPVTIERMGDYIRWINSDIANEEADTLGANKLSMKDVGRAISSKARAHFQDLLNKEVGI